MGLRFRAASSRLHAALRLAAQDDHEIRVFAGLRAQRLVGDDQGRSRRHHPGDTIQCVLWNDNPVERAFSRRPGPSRSAQCPGRAPPRARPRASTTAARGRPSSKVTALHRMSAPPFVRSMAVKTCVPIGRSASRIVTGLSQDGLKGAPDIEALGLAADEHRYRLELARRLLRRLGGRAPHGVGRDSRFPRRRDGIELRLQLGLGGGPLRLQFGDPRDAFALASSACALASAEIAEPSAVSAAANCSSALSFRFSATRTGTIAFAASREAVTAASLA